MADLTIQLTLPLPSSASAQNRHTAHDLARWRDGLRTDRVLGAAAARRALAGIRDIPQPIPGVVLMDLTFRIWRHNCTCGAYHPKDWTNAAGAVKGLVDGLVDGGLLAGDDFDHLVGGRVMLERVPSQDLEGVLVVLRAREPVHMPLDRPSEVVMA